MPSLATRPQPPTRGGSPGRIDLPAHETLARPVCPEELARVTATAADLVVQGRRVTVRVLASLTGIDPLGVQSAVVALVDDGLLRPEGPAPQHYVFAPGRWPLGAPRS